MSETRKYRNVSHVLLGDVAAKPVQPGAEFEADPSNPALGTYLRVGYAVPLDSPANEPHERKARRKKES